MSQENVEIRVLRSADPGYRSATGPSAARCNLKAGLGGQRF